MTDSPLARASAPIFLAARLVVAVTLARRTLRTVGGLRTERAAYRQQIGLDRCPSMGLACGRWTRPGKTVAHGKRQAFRGARLRRVGSQTMFPPPRMSYPQDAGMDWMRRPDVY
ncbi:hypothetical protein HYW17_00470 [Candidatus Uhrbacteria bacterium]|nr:hypothetical protein [Candidatus Uhrbacteria bacterium]